MNLGPSLKVKEGPFIEADIESPYVTSGTVSESQLNLVIYFIPDIEISFLHKYYVITFF
jgi:hypothetical protein